MEDLDVNVEVVALFDVYEAYTSRDLLKVSQRYLDIGKAPNMTTLLDKKAKRYSDFRKLLELQDIDAVCITTPDHWHAVQIILALFNEAHG